MDKWCACSHTPTNHKLTSTSPYLPNRASPSQDLSTIVVHRWHSLEVWPPNTSSVHAFTKKCTHNRYSVGCAQHAAEAPQSDDWVNLLSPAISHNHQLLKSISTRTKCISPSHTHTCQAQQGISTIEHGNIRVQGVQPYKQAMQVHLIITVNKMTMYLAAMPNNQ